MVQDSTLIRRLFDTVRPNGTTPIGEKLESLLLYYLDNLEHAKSLYDAGNQAPLKAIKPANYIVITDGAPSLFLRIYTAHARSNLRIIQRTTQNL